MSKLSATCANSVLPWGGDLTAKRARRDRLPRSLVDWAHISLVQPVPEAMIVKHAAACTKAQDARGGRGRKLASTMGALYTCGRQSATHVGLLAACYRWQAAAAVGQAKRASREGHGPGSPLSPISVGGKAGSTASPGGRMGKVAEPRARTRMGAHLWMRRLRHIKQS